MGKNKLTKEQQNHQNSLNMMQNWWQKFADKSERVNKKLKEFAANHKTSMN